MSHAPTRRQVAFVAAALLLSPLLTLYATQAVWLQNLLTPFSWMASHLPASGLFWLLFFSLMLPLYGLTRRLFIAYLPGTGFCMTLAIISRYKMEMFTGLTSSLLREGDTLNTLSLSVYQDLPTTARLLKNAGYSTVALHSHTDELYNRANVLPRIGFDTVAFRENFMTEGAEDGAYLSDASLVQEMIARYESRDPSKPIFLYGLSMENHQLYTAEKYSYPSGIDVQCDKLSQEDKAILDSLVLGLHHADASLAALVEYFSQVDRPVMLVFVGDHLPSLNLADGTPIYTRLGYSPTPEASDWDADTLENMLSTNYLIWTNYETQAVSDHKESCTFLGLHMLQRAGIPLNQYFTWLADHAANQMLLSRNRFFADENGVGSYTTTPEQAAMLETYTAMERNLLYNR